MRSVIFRIFGRKHKIITSLDHPKEKKLQEEIKNELDLLAARYPDADKIDILSFYVIELWERIIDLENSVSKTAEKQKNIKSRLEKTRDFVEKEIDRLTNLR